MFEALVLTWALIDGDTMRVTARVWPGIVVEERVRFLEVDTPERHANTQCERALAEAATLWVREKLIPAQKIEIDAEQRDSFGRVLAYVWVDGVQLNAAMLTAGIARPYGVRTPWC